MALNRWERKERLGHGAVTAIALQTNRSVAHVSRVLNDKRRSKKVEQAIAKRIGLPVEKVFPKVAA